MKQILLLSFLFVTYLSSSQVGVNTNNPTAALHVKAETIGQPGLRVISDIGDVATFNVMGITNAGIGLNITSEGVGRVLNVQSNSSTSTENLLFFYNQGLGRALELVQNNSSNNEVTALIINKGLDDALQVSNQNALNDQPAGAFFHSGLGRAMAVVQLNENNTESTLYISNNSTQTSTPGDGMGVFAQTESLRAGYFVNKGTGNNSAGIYGRNEGGGTGGVGGVVASAAGIDSIFAVYAFGDIAGTSKSFLIDHPLDPANKMLKHFSIESDEPMLIYRGKITLDESGKATVQLKDYQEAILKNISYNLTAIGSPTIAYIEQEMDRRGQFIIAGNHPGATIHWTIYGERADAYFEFYPRKKEVEIVKKGDAKGKFLNPEAHGLPESYGLDQAYRAKK